MQMRIKYFFLFLLSIQSVLFFVLKGSEIFEITGSIEFALENNKKEIAMVLGSIDANTLQECIEELLIENKWKWEKTDANNVRIFLEEEFVRAYDLGYSNSGCKIDFTVMSTVSTSTYSCNSVSLHPSGK